MYAYTFINAYSHCAQSCLTLCDPMDCGPLGSSVHGISQTRILQGIFWTRGSNPHLFHLLHRQVDSLPLRHLCVCYA